MGFRKITKRGCYKKALKLVLASNVFRQGPLHAAPISKSLSRPHGGPQTRLRQKEVKKAKRQVVW
jgi:hypothetical protein